MPPQEEILDRGSSRTNANDPGGLRKAADIAPGIIVAVLRDFLPPPTGSSKLVLPLGAGACPSPGGIGDYQRTSAAGAIRSLAATHAGIVAQLVEPLIRNLGVPEDDQYGIYPVGNVQRALATLLVLDIGDVANRLDAAGRSASNDMRQRLFGVLNMAVSLLDPGDRFREPGDPHPSDDRRHALLDRLVHICLRRVGGDWGDEVRYSAAKLVEELAEIEPTWTFSHLDAILGTFLTTVEQIDREPTPSLTVLDATSPQLRALESFSRRNSIGSAARELLSAVEHVAGVDVLAVCTVIIALIIDERDTDRGAETVWRLLPLLGKIGKQHGAIPGLLQQILPALHTYILDTDPSLRSAALQAWVEIGSSHQLPSSLTDLLPALLTDNYSSVIRAVLAAARRLTWNDQSHAQLLVYAVQICASVDAKDHADVLKSAMSTLDFLTRGNDQARAYAEKIILQRAADLDRYDLRDALRRNWSQETKQTLDMAVLRLRQARDPHINDRFNQRDDQQLCELLDCGPGLIALPTEDLIAAALGLAPNHPIGSAEFTEVAWRAGRPNDAATIMRAVIDATPHTPAYEQARALETLLVQAATFDAAAAAGDDLDDAAAALEVTIAAHKTNTGGDRQATMLRQIRARTTARFLLAGKETPENLAHSPDCIDSTHGRGHAAARRARADHLALVAVELTALSQRRTATGEYLRAFANLCEIAVHLLRFDAAELEADIEAANTQRIAARRRAALVETELLEQFAPEDPLIAPLAAALHTAKFIDGNDIGATLASWAALPLPLLVVGGPRRSQRSDPEKANTKTDVVEHSVAVVLAFVDGRLVTGPQVLRPATAYELQLDIQPGEWPEWADQLDVELLSHFTAHEAQTPAFSWRRLIQQGNDAQLIGTGTLILRFCLSAGQPAPPFLIALRWRGTCDGQPVTQALDVAGHRELRFRPFDTSRDFLTDFPVFDERLLALYESLHRADYDQDQLQAFCRLFTSVCRAGLRMTWNMQYRRGTHVSEKKFHDDLYACLLAEPELGGRLERGSPLALGFLDVRHDGITAELKVERRTPVSKTTAPKYMGQPTQYASADGARLSILCVLDMSPKTAPVGTPENYLFTLQPALHGLDNPEAPSLVVAIVVNGNLPTPSSWSRRKAAVQPQSTET